MKKYGLLMAMTKNLGDDIQSLAAKQFLPGIDVFLERDFLNRVNFTKNIRVIMNGWFTHHPENWPPSPKIEPLFISFHIAPHVADKMLSKKTIEYLKKYEPIGCRDEHTKKLLEKIGVNAYFSGCLTLTLDHGYGHLKDQKNSLGLLVVDLDKDVLKYLPKRVLRNSFVTSHSYFDTSKILQKIVPLSLRKIVRRMSLVNNNVKKMLYVIDRYRSGKISVETRLRVAEEQLQRLANTQLLITSRLHAALPAIAFGVPVIFVHRNLNDPRFTGLLKYMNHYSIFEFKKHVNEIDWENPPRNPLQGEVKELKRNLIKKCQEFIEDV